VSVKKAKSLYESFREQPVGRARKVRINFPKAVAVMGYLEFVGYSTTHAGEAKLYKHKFAKGSRPLICAGPNDNQLYLVGGRFRVTGRGIVDLTPKRREIDD
jgi:hypothetical protein